jgi:hypothetical protein
VNVHLACPTTLGAPKTISRGPRSLPTGITQAKNGRDGPREIAGATRPPSSCTDSCEAPVAKACKLDLALSSVCLSKLHDAGVEGPAWGSKPSWYIVATKVFWEIVSVDQHGKSHNPASQGPQSTPGENGAQASVDLQRLPGPRARQAELEPQINGRRSNGVIWFR